MARSPDKQRDEGDHPNLETQRELRVALSAARLGLWRADLRTKTVETMQFGGPLTGLPLELVPKNLDDLMALIVPEDRDVVGRAVERATSGERDNEGDYKVDFRIILPDGAIRWVHSRGEVVRDAAGAPVALVGVDMDITDRKQAEQERRELEAHLQHAQRLESLGVLAGGIAHDFNNLLVGILGNADLALLDLQPGAPAYQRVEDIRTAGTRASELTSQMLAYSGRGRFVVELLDLNGLISEMSPLLHVAIGKSCDLRYELGRDLPPVEADGAQLRQVVMNLITNAAESIGEQPGRISIVTASVDLDAGELVDWNQGGEKLRGGRYVSLQVSDDGGGMDQATQERIFEPFFTTKFTGRGLGLASVLGIVRGHHGAIRVDSEPGRGATFKILLPGAEVAAKPASGEARSPEGAPWTGAGVVLVVDDDEVVRDVITQTLNGAGISVITAPDGQAGVEAFEQHLDSVALVMLDLTMPRLSGEETLRLLQQLRADVPVIVMSGYNEVEVTNRFVGQGVAGFLQKPFRVDALLALVRANLENRSTED